MIIEILELAAALEWIALGVLVFFKLRSLKRRAMDLMDSLEAIETIEVLGLEEVMPESEKPKRKPTMNEVRALYGLGAISENERAYMQKETTNDADR
jgi:hypothetical protein|nr:MAG TPA: hypothetical protein [Caudoviricetes sp.]